MELKIKTEKLQDMVSKAAKCVSNNKLIPITSLINLKVSNGVFTVTATDSTNYFYVTHNDKVECEDFEVSLVADLFVKLVQKITSEYIKMSVDGNVFKVEGNGNYMLEMPLDESGNIIKFPKKLPDMEPPVSGVVKLSNVNFMLTYNKPSLADSMVLPAITCYYCGDKVVTSNSVVACASDIKVFDKPFLITSQMMELLGVMSEDDINFYLSEDEMIFWDKSETVYAPLTKGIESFPIEALNKFLSSEFESNCELSKTALLDVLDRISLFVSSYDEKVIVLVFTKDGLMVKSNKSDGTELIPYVSSNNFKDFMCKIQFDLLIAQLKTHENDTVTLHYGHESVIKLSSVKVSQVIGLVSEQSN